MQPKKAGKEEMNSKWRTVFEYENHCGPVLAEKEKTRVRLALVGTRIGRQTGRSRGWRGEDG